MEIVLVSNDDWIEVYKDGDLVYEGHSISPGTLLDCLDIPYTYHDITLEAQDGSKWT
jgi:hypothetical protein